MDFPLLEFIISFFFVASIGTALHFAYEWSGHNKLVAIFAAVNESTWEHIKIMLSAFFLWSLYDGFVYGGDANYFVAKFVSLVAAIVVMPALFYTHKALFKHDSLAFDIAIFLISVAVGQIVFYALMIAPAASYLTSYFSVVLLFMLFGAYLLLTMLPLKNEIFRDPITHRFGLRGHTDLKPKAEPQPASKSAHK